MFQPACQTRSANLICIILFRLFLAPSQRSLQLPGLATYPNHTLGPGSVSSTTFLVSDLFLSVHSFKRVSPSPASSGLSMVHGACPLHGRTLPQGKQPAQGGWWQYKQIVSLLCLLMISKNRIPHTKKQLYIHLLYLNRYNFRLQFLPLAFETSVESTY